MVLHSTLLYCYVLHYTINFSHSNTIYFAQSDLLFYLRAAILALIYYDFLSLLLPASFLFISLYYASIGYANEPHLCMICSAHSVSSLLAPLFTAISDQTNLDQLSLVQLAQFCSVFISSIPSNFSYNNLPLG